MTTDDRPAVPRTSPAAPAPCEPFRGHSETGAGGARRAAVIFGPYSSGGFRVRFTRGTGADRQRLGEIVEAAGGAWTHTVGGLLPDCASLVRCGVCAAQAGFDVEVEPVSPEQEAHGAARLDAYLSLIERRRVAP